MYRRGHGLFILPALMFGGWIAVAVVGSILGLVGTLIGGLFRGLAALASGVFSGSGIAGGILIGLLFLYKAVAYLDRDARRRDALVKAETL